jgi:hypothetical protein
MTQPHGHPLEQLWSLLLAGEVTAAGALLEPVHEAPSPVVTWDDPLFDRAEGEDILGTAIPRLSTWVRGRSSGGPGAVQHLRTIADDRRVVVESVLALENGMVWKQAEQRSEKAARFELAAALVADRSSTAPGRYRAIRVYFSTWAVLDGASRLRVGPICPDERSATKEAMDALPTVRRYFDCLATGNPEIIDLFEPDGYFREPANNFACGREQLGEHFQHILKLGGVGIELLTATRQGERIGLELQTVVWGTKKMLQPQAGFAAYELGPHGKLQGSRVYDSVVPPELA